MNVIARSDSIALCAATTKQSHEMRVLLLSSIRNIDAALLMYREIA